MNRFIEKIQRLIINNKTYLIYSSILSLIYFGFDYSIEYSTDAYASYMDKGSWVFSFYENARPVKGVIFYILENMNLSAGILYHLSWFCAMLFMILSVTVLAGVYNKYLASEKLSAILSFLILANPLVIEYFLFEEKGLFILTILLNVIAMYITEYMWSHNTAIKGWVKGTIGIVILLLNAVFIYQTSVQVYVILCLPLILFNSGNFVDFIKKNLYVGFMYAIPMGTAFITAKYILVIDRSEGSFSPAHAISVMVSLAKEITFNKFFHMGKGYFALWTLGICAITILSVLMAQKRKMVVLLSFLYLMAGTIIVSLIIFAISDSAIPSPRTTHSYGMLFGVVLVYFFYLVQKRAFGNENMSFKITKISGISEVLYCFSKAIAMFVIATLLIVEFISFEKVFVERYQCNEADRYYAQIIREQIRQYEDETGNEVDTICFYSDADRMWWDDGYGDSEMMARAQSCGWSRLTSINLYLDRNYVEGEQDSELAEYFAAQNWGMYSEDQVVFRDNELHLCIY